MPKELVKTPDAELKFIIDGKEIPFNHFTPKESNLIKVNIIHVDGMSEGIWACISDEDMKDYENNVMDDKIRPALLRNSSLLGPCWGCYIPMRLNGNERPVFNFTDMLSGKLCFNPEDTVK